MKEIIFTGDVKSPYLHDVRQVVSQQKVAQDVNTWQESGEKSLNQVLDEHYKYHTGQWLIHRDTITELLDYGVMQFFGFPIWNTPSLDKVKEWIGGRSYIPVDRKVCDLEVFFRISDRRWMNALKRREYKIPEQQVQMRCVAKELIVSAACVIHKERKKLIKPVS